MTQIQDILKELDKHPTDDQIRMVKQAMRNSPEMLASKEMTVWIKANRDRIIEMAMAGELEV